MGDEAMHMHSCNSYYFSTHSLVITGALSLGNVEVLGMVRI